MPTSLLLSDAPGEGASLRAALEAAGYLTVAEIADPQALTRETTRLTPDVIVVCTPTPTAPLLHALKGLGESAPRPIVMFASDARREVIRKTVEAGVAAYVVDGWAPQRVGAIIEAASARFDAYESLRRELRAIHVKLAERKLVEKAKGLVMQQRGVSEDQAYSSLRKMAMDQNLTLAEVARRVIAVAHLLA